MNPENGSPEGDRAGPRPQAAPSPDAEPGRRRDVRPLASHRAGDEHWDNTSAPVLRQEPGKVVVDKPSRRLSTC